MILKKILFAVFFCVTVSGFSQTATNESLQTLLEKKREFNKNAKNGFCIQLYNGDEESAIEHMIAFSELFPEIEIKRIYKVPEWKIQTITYKTRIEADRILNKIKKEYPGARVL